MLSTFMMLNLVVAAILENFITLSKVNPRLPSSNDVEAFTLVWEGLDPEGKGMLHVDTLPDLLLSLSPPLGLKNVVGASREQAGRYILQLQMGGAGKTVMVGEVAFHHVLLSFTQFPFVEGKVDLNNKRVFAVEDAIAAALRKMVVEEEGHTEKPTLLPDAAAAAAAAAKAKKLQKLYSRDGLFVHKQSRQQKRLDDVDEFLDASIDIIEINLSAGAYLPPPRTCPTGVKRAPKSPAAGRTRPDINSGAAAATPTSPQRVEVGKAPLPDKAARPFPFPAGGKGSSPRQATAHLLLVRRI